MVTAWLIELNDVQLCYSLPHWSHRWVVFTDPVAWRFPDEASAERIIEEHKLTDVSAVEHGWSDVTNT